MEKSANSTSSKKTFSDYLRLWFKWVLDPLGGFFNSLGLTPNTMTMLGLVGNSVGAYYLARGDMLTGGILVLLMTPIDALDGTMARLRGESGDFGAFVDSVTDRYSELIIYGGLLYHFLIHKLTSVSFHDTRWHDQELSGKGYRSDLLRRVAKGISSRPGQCRATETTVSQRRC